LTQRQVVARDEGLALDLTGDDDHGDRVDVGPIHTVEGVDATRAAGHVDDGRAAGESGVALRGDGTGLLVVVEDRGEPGLPAQRVVQVHGATARDHEHPLETVVRQQRRDEIGYPNARHGGMLQRLSSELSTCQRCSSISIRFVSSCWIEL